MDTRIGNARPAARLTVLAGPSGVAIHRLVELVRARAPAVRVPVRVTTRARRAREDDGAPYRFVDRATFARMVETGRLLEWLEVGGRCYGTPREPVEAWLRAGEPVLLVLDPPGARQVRRTLPEARLVYLARPAGGLPGTSPGTSPGTEPSAEFDITIDSGRYSLVPAVNELVGLLGSPALL